MFVADVLLLSGPRGMSCYAVKHYTQQPTQPSLPTLPLSSSHLHYITFVPYNPCPSLCTSLLTQSTVAHGLSLHLSSHFLLLLLTAWAYTENQSELSLCFCFLFFGYTTTICDAIKEKGITGNFNYMCKDKTNT